MVTEQAEALALAAAELKKVLELERRRGFDDRATTLGLDRYLAAWVTRSLAATEGPDQERAVRAFYERLAPYKPLSAAERAGWAEGVLAALTSLDGVAGDGGGSVVTAPGSAGLRAGIGRDSPSRGTEPRRPAPAGATEIGTGARRPYPHPSPLPLGEG